MVRSPVAGIDEVSSATRTAERVLDFVVGIRLFAVLAALVAAVAPAIMAKADGETLRGSISAYWNVEPRTLFWVPFTIAGVLLLVDAVLSYVSPNRNDYGGRWYNIILGVSLLILTWRDKDNFPEWHYPAAGTFFTFFIIVIAYTSCLGWIGDHIPQPRGTAAIVNGHNREAEKVTAQTSVMFLVLLLITLVAYFAGWITFYFFEVFALLNFALYFVQGLISPFPFTHYEFPWASLNRLLRALRIMRRPVTSA